mmetsp:Transcript_46073/g.98514  ORF Transcript_46073/g.98514 Transcript_46073/m.98514 type:complete len:259 (-) Transcript_46073:589-1365(-)
MKRIGLLLNRRKCQRRAAQPLLDVRKVRRIHHRGWDVRRIGIHFPIRIPVAHCDGIRFSNCSRKHNLRSANKAGTQVLCCHCISDSVSRSDGCPRGRLVCFNRRAAPNSGFGSCLDLLQNLGLSILPESFALGHDCGHVTLSLSLVYGFVLLPLRFKRSSRRLPRSRRTSLRLQPRNGPHGLVRRPKRRGLGRLGHHGIGPPRQGALAQAGEHGSSLLGTQRWEVRQAGQLGAGPVGSVAQQPLGHHVALRDGIGRRL